MTNKKNITILIAPLDWGLGHATRCIPIIRQLQNLDCNVVIATDGLQENVLKKEFPDLFFVTLKGYNISYTKHKRWFSIKIISQLPKILRAIRHERVWLNQFIKQYPVDIIISDNRYGLYHKKIFSILITHQLQIQAPYKVLETIMRKLLYRRLNNFSTVWVPDLEAGSGLAGLLSHPVKLPQLPLQYIGPLSRFQYSPDVPEAYDVLIILSGPEPQRTIFEQLIIKQLQTCNYKTLLVRGVPRQIKSIELREQVTVCNHLPASELQLAFAKARFIISRSGYTTVMDIIKMKKKAILIPTPGQTEQEYLAKHLAHQQWCMACDQHHFDLQKLLSSAEKFSFVFPSFKMDEYKQTIEELVKSFKGI